MEEIIKTQGLTKGFKGQLAVDNIDLCVEKGSIFAFLGPNGAGKTTTIKIIMNIIRADGGSSAVMGTNSKNLGPNQFEQIGYVSENQDMPDWMTVAQFLAYCRSMYPNWDEGFCRDLIKQFDLPLNKKIKDLSRGMIMKVALISSISYRPQLLILDEPFGGLDPLVREDLISGVLDITENEDWTIFISSHDIEEVERLADRVGIINKGQLILMEETETLQNRFRKVEVILNQPLQDDVPPEEDWYDVQKHDHVIRFIDSQYRQDESENQYKKLFPDNTRVQTHVMTLREIFLGIAKHFSIKGL